MRCAQSWSSATRGDLYGFEQPFGRELLRRRRLRGVVDIGARIRFFGADLREALAVGAADEHGLLAGRALVRRFQRFAPVDLEIAEHRHFLRNGKSGNGEQSKPTRKSEQRHHDPSNESHFRFPRYGFRCRTKPGIPAAEKYTPKSTAG